MNLDGLVDDSLQHVRRDHLDRGDLGHRVSHAHRIDLPRGVQGEQAGLVDRHARIGDAFEVAAQLQDRLAERDACHAAGDHQFQRVFRRADRTHAVVDAAWPEAALRDRETLAGTDQQVLFRHADTVEHDLAMPVRRIETAVSGQHPLDAHAGRVHRHQHHAVAGMRLGIRMRQTHEDRELAVRVTNAGGPPLAAIQHQLIAILADGRLHVGGVAGGHVRLGHAEHRADFAVEQRLQPTCFLRLAAEVMQHFHVAGVRRVAVEDLRGEFVAAHQLGQRRVLERGQPGAGLCVWQEQVPQTGGARLRLPLFHHWRHAPAAPVGAGVDRVLETVFRLARRNVLGQECLQSLQVRLRLRAVGEIHQPTLSSSLPVFSPRNSLSSVSGKVSNPSTMSSRDFRRPSASQPAISCAASP